MRTGTVVLIVVCAFVAILILAAMAGLAASATPIP
jgi:hypothetical protein